MSDTFLDRHAPLLDLHDYPKRWQDYVGQDNAKRMLQVATKSARMRRQPLDHVLVAHGASGIGKTALAVLIASEMGRKARVITGQVGAGTARIVLESMKNGDVLIYDEFHQVMDAGKKHAEWLLTYLQDGIIMGPQGAEKYPRVTMIAATTHASKVPETILSRFPLQPPMENYTDEEAAQIAVIMSKGVLDGLPKLGVEDALLIAQGANGNPRAIRSLLTLLRDMTIIGELQQREGRYDIPGLLNFQGITHDGLDRLAQNYLKALALEFAGNAGIRSLEDRLQQPGGLTFTERVLMDKGYVAKTRSGRTLTQAGIRRFRELQEAS